MASKEMSAFPAGGPNESYAQYFIGQSYLNMLSTEPVTIGNVTFEPKCRNNWHSHHADQGGGQILLVAVGGKGALGGHAQGAAQGGGVPAQRAHVLCQDGAGKQHPFLTVAVGTVQGDQYVKPPTGEIQPLARPTGAPGRDG